ncbi:MFS transporter [Pyruvatibacter mobilis]|uniref:MFS transporter n=1 Tax=Pyruvatibacter mobilis TaxID=1712261 RepID=UPI003C7ADE13
MTTESVSAPVSTPMSTPVSATGGPVASRAGQVSWALFDWANQPYFTLITTFIFAPYFAATYVGDPTLGQALWGQTLGVAGLVIAFVSPILGSIADQTGRRKPWLFACAVVFCLSAAALWFAVPGAGAVNPLPIMVAAGMAAIAMEFAVVFNNAMLPSLVSSTRMGALSGFGWGIGYVGGLVALILMLFFMAASGETGLTMIGTAPWFGLDPALNEADRFAGPMAALWFALFVIPLFVFTPDAAATGVSPGRAVRQGLSKLKTTLGHLRRYRNVALYLVSRMLYFDGLSAIFAFGGIYAAGIFGWELMTLGLFGIILSVFAAAGAFIGGWLDDRIGSKPTILIAVAGLVVATVGSASIGPDTVFFVVPVAPPEAGAAPFSSVGEQIYLLFGILIGMAGGPAQAASRTLMARMAPPSMMTEFFGLYALSGKATAFLAPLAIAWATTAYASQRAGLIVIVAFLVIGFMLLLGVRERQEDAI